MKQLISRFVRDRDGSTIEVVIWMPIFVLILSLIADTSMIFFGQSRVYLITQVANRAYSVGNLENTDAVSEYIVAAVERIGATATVDVQVTDGIIHTKVVVPARPFEAIGLFSTLSNINLTITSDLVKETT